MERSSPSHEGCKEARRLVRERLWAIEEAARLLARQRTGASAEAELLLLLKQVGELRTALLD